MRRSLTRAGRAAALAAALLAAGQPAGLAQGPGVAVLPPRAVQPKDKDKDAAAPPGPPILPASFPGDPPPGVPLTFREVILLAGQANLDIAQGALFVERARANLLRARAGLLPNLSLGGTYTAHEGQIQRTEGTVVSVNRDSLFVGLGASYNVNLADAVFLPREAASLLDAARSGQVRITNDSLLRVSEAYFTMMRARRRLARLDEVLEFLTSERESPLRGNSKGLLPLIRDFVRAGQALPSDQARVEADVVRRQEERVLRIEELRTSSAELARLLHLNPTFFLLPGEDYRWPLRLAGEEWSGCPIDVLVEQALRSRPELAENQAFLDAAVARYRATRWRPLLPSLVVNYAAGGFGGGPAVERTATGGTRLGSSGTIADFDTRSDLDLGLVWRLRGLGLVDIAATRDARLRIEQTRVQQMQIQDTVVAQVVQALEQVERGRQRVEIAYAGLFDDQGRPTGAVYRSLLLNFTRIKAGQGLPLEALDSTRRQSDVLESYANALTDYDRARFRLLVALGLPPEALLDPRCLPAPPANCPPARLLHLPGPLPARQAGRENGERNDEPGMKPAGPGAVRGVEPVRFAAPAGQTGMDTPPAASGTMVRGVPLPPVGAAHTSPPGPRPDNRH